MRKDTEGEVEILKRFWPSETEDEDAVPLPLVYADLLAMADARCLEAAELIYKEVVDGFER